MSATWRIVLGYALMLADRRRAAVADVCRTASKLVAGRSGNDGRGHRPPACRTSSMCCTTCWSRWWRSCCWAAGWESCSSTSASRA